MGKRKKAKKELKKLGTRTHAVEYQCERVCVLCGNTFQVEGAAVECVSSWKEDQGQGLKWHGVLCPKCVSLGPEGASLRGKKHAQKLADEANKIGDLAEGIGNMADAEWTTIEDWAKDQILSYPQLGVDLAEKALNRSAGQFFDEDEIPF